MDDMIEDNVLTGGYCEGLFKERPDLCDIPALLYYLKINNGQYHKVGVTRNSVADRWRGIKNKAAGEADTYETLMSKKTTLLNAFRLEQKILQTVRGHRVIRPWSTELFSLDISVQIAPFFS